MGRVCVGGYDRFLYFNISVVNMLCVNNMLCVSSMETNYVVNILCL